MRQACGAHHQGQSNQKDVDLVPTSDERIRVGCKTQIRMYLIQSFQQVDAGSIIRADQFASKANLGQQISGQSDTNCDCGYEKGRDQDPVLGHLRPGYSLHAAERRVDKNDRHADDDTHVDIHFQKTAEDHAHAAHLSGDIGERDKDGTDHCGHSCHVRFVAITDEIRNRVVSELSQVWGEQEGQQDKPSGPAHEIDPSRISHGRDQARHRNVRRGAHPVRCGGHSVRTGRHSLSGDVKTPGVGDTAQPGDRQIETKGEADEEVGPALYAHRASPRRLSSISRWCAASSRFIKRQ